MYTLIAQRRAGWAVNPHVLREALLSYYATPAGYSLFHLRDEQNQDSTDLLDGSIVEVAKFRQAVDAFRKDAFRENTFQTGTPPAAHSCHRFPSHFPERDTERLELTADQLNAYVEFSANWTDQLEKAGDENAYLPLRWHTSNGFAYTTSYQRGGMVAVENHPYTFGDCSEDAIKTRVEHIQRVIHAHRLEKPLLVYRGLNSDHFPGGKTPDIDTIHSVFPVGSVHHLGVFSSASVDPAKSTPFASSDVVLEMVGRSVAPVGGISNWGWSEREVVVNSGTQWRVRNVLEDQRVGRLQCGLRVVQLEEVGG